MYMDDAIKATIDLMQAPKESISIRYGYNLSSMSFTPAEIAEETLKCCLDSLFPINQTSKMAASGVNPLTDSVARKALELEAQSDLGIHVPRYALPSKKNNQ